jgi:hypothetical protein
MLPVLEGAAMPAVFSRALPEDIEEDPGAALIVHPAPGLVEDAAHWLQRRDRPVPEIAARVDDVEDDVRNEIDQLLDQVWNIVPAQRCRVADRLRDGRVLRGLVTGACLLRRAHEEAAPAATTEHVLENYERIRLLLCHTTAGTPDDPLQHLAVDMVSRANTYMDIRFGEDQSDRNPFRPENLAYWLDRMDDRPPREPISRREVADLGNVGSGTVRRLIGYLQQTPGGYARFLGMGLARGRPDPDTWHRQPARVLASLLRSWSYKQVRTHFQRLQRAGLITAERRYQNGPWCYQLPEELTNGRSRFDYLPTADELRSEAVTP